MKNTTLQTSNISAMEDSPLVEDIYIKLLTPDFVCQNKYVKLRSLFPTSEFIFVFD